MSEDLMRRLEKTAKQWPDFQTEYEVNPGQRQGVENDKRVIAGDHLPYMAGMGALPGLGAGITASALGAFGKSGVGKAIGTGVSTIGGAGLGYNMGKGIQERIKNFNEDAINELSAKQQLTDQEQFFLDRARMVAGQNKTASELMERLEKTASIGGAFKGVGNYAKNFFGTNVRKAQNKLDNISPLPTQLNKTSRDAAKKDLHNAKVDRNRAVAGTAGVATLGGAGLGGYTAYQKSKEPVVEDIMTQNQVTQVGQQKVADELMDRLEKTANEAYGQNAEYQNRKADERIFEIVNDLFDKDPAYIESALAQEGLLDRAVESGFFKDPTPGEGALAGGVIGGLAGAMGGGIQGGIMGAFEGKPLKGAGIGAGLGALGVGGIMAGLGGAEGLYRKFHPSDLHLKYHGGDGQQTTAPDVSPAHEENTRQGAGSVSNAPAGVDKSASELMERLEKTAAEEGQPRQDRSFATETLWGAGPLGYYAKRDNTMGVNPEDSHTAANAKLYAMQAGGTGALTGGVAGGLMGHGAGGKAGIGAGIGALAGGLYGAGVGALGGAINGSLHDSWDKNHPVQEEQLASEGDTLMERLEKTAAEWREDGAAGADLGARLGGGLGAVGGGVSGAMAGGASKGALGAVGGGALGALGGGLLGAGGGAAGFGIQGALNGAAKDIVGYETPEDKSNVGPSALAGAGVGAVMGGASGLKVGGPKGALVQGVGSAVTGGLLGAGIGAMRDHREEKQASESEGLMERLEKTAGIGNAVAGIGGKLKGYANTVTGKNYKAAKNNAADTQKTFDTWNTPEALKANAPKIGVSNFRNKLESLEGDNLLAQGKVVSEKSKMKKAIGGTVAGVGAVGGGLAAASKPKEQEKIANEATEEVQEKVATQEDDVLTGLFKEAAAAILDIEFPSVKQHVDPMDRIKF